MKVNRLNVVKNIGLAGLTMMHTRIPINPLKLVRACIICASSFLGRIREGLLRSCSCPSHTGSSEQADEEGGGLQGGAA